jgi:hypothetical protein
MRFYRVSLFIDSGSSAGFDWATTRAHANAIAAQHKTEHPKDESARGEVEEVNIEPSKQGILKALKMYAAHPDNG